MQTQLSDIIGDIDKIISRESGPCRIDVRKVAQKYLFIESNSQMIVLYEEVVRKHYLLH